MGAIYLGVDIGTTSAKCLAVDENGSILALEQHPYALEHRHQGWAEQDADGYWRALIEVVSKCVNGCDQIGRSRSEIKSLALSTQGDTLILTDEAGNPLVPAMSWMDARGEGEFRDLLEKTGASFWYQQTGQPLNGVSSACKLSWTAKNLPDIWRSTKHVCYVADFLCNRLVGRFVSDVPSASWTSLYSPFECGWSQDVVDLLGISPNQLPETKSSGEIIGELLPDVADKLGLPRETKVVAGAFDQAAAALGAGAICDGVSVLSCGTAWVLYMVSKTPMMDKNQHLAICRHTNRSEWGLVLPFTGGSAYDWLVRTLAETEGCNATGSDPLVFVPHLYGGLSPDWRGESRGSILGLTLSHTQEDIRLALMHGLAYEARRNVEAAGEVGKNVPAIRMVGGAGKSTIWPQIIANVLNKTVEVSSSVESACYGAAKLAAGSISSNWECAQSKTSFHPIADELNAENTGYQRHIKFYEALLPLYDTY